MFAKLWRGEVLSYINSTRKYLLAEVLRGSNLTPVEENGILSIDLGGRWIGPRVLHDNSQSFTEILRGSKNFFKM